MNGRFPRGGGEPIWRRIRDFIAEPLQAAAEEQRSYLNSPQGQRFDWRVAIMLVSVAVLLTVQKYAVIDSGGTGWGVQEHLIDWLENSYRGLSPQLDYDDHDRLASLTYWALGNFVLYVLVPAAIIKRLFRERLAEHGAKLRGWHDCWWVYLAMYLIMLPAILLASSWESFQHKYPFYRLHPIGPKFYVWEIWYAVQFMSLEFFFRGFMVQTGRKRFGAYTILVMMVPYCMIHFGKPMAETLGAIVAGVLLGFMALKTRSIWLGAALHIAVAWTMDAVAVWQRSF